VTWKLQFTAEKRCSGNGYSIVIPPNKSNHCWYLFSLSY